MDFIKTLQAHLPSNDEAGKYVEVVRRLSQLLCLASLLPVLGECRFSRLNRASARFVPQDTDSPPKPKAGAKATAKAQAAAQKDAPKPPAEPPAVQDDSADAQRAPLGLISVVLFAMSEVCSSWELFVPVGNKKEAEKKGGPVVALLQAAKKASDGITSRGKSSSGGVVDGAFVFIKTLLDDDSVFASAHHLAMIVVLVIAAVYIVQFLVMRPGKSLQASLASVIKGLVFLLPVALFGALHREKISKVCSVMAAEKLFDSLWLPLRCAALCFSQPPQADQRGGTPGIFAAFQVASIFGMISCDLIRDSTGLVRAINQFVSTPRLSDLIGSPILSSLLPKMLALVWLYCAHLSRSIGALFVSMLCCIASQPIIVAMGWPKVAVALSLGKTAGPAMLQQFLSVAYAVNFLCSIIMGGTISFVGVCALAHLVSGIHGVENLISFFQG